VGSCSAKATQDRDRDGGEDAGAARERTKTEGTEREDVGGYSSRLHRSTDGSLISRWSFFISLLSLWIGLRNQRSRFPAPKPHGAKQPLALPHAHLDAVPDPQVVRQEFAVPQILRVAMSPRRTAQRPLEFLPLNICIARGMFILLLCAPTAKIKGGGAVPWIFWLAAPLSLRP
jgi:hypothetical protein